MLHCFPIGGLVWSRLVNSSSLNETLDLCFSVDVLHDNLYLNLRSGPNGRTNSVSHKGVLADLPTALFHFESAKPLPFGQDI